jgi:signal transduction histidine kinase
MTDRPAQTGRFFSLWKVWWSRISGRELDVQTASEGFEFPAESAPAAPASAPEPAKISREDVMRILSVPTAQDEAPDLVAQRAAFWATATHDLCQPAQALALFLDRLRRQLPPGAPTDVHGYLESSMRDLSRLLEGLMEVAQIDAGEIQAARCRNS